jgi:hypothetical protein
MDQQRMSKIGRRQFLKLIGITAGVVILNGCATKNILTATSASATPADTSTPQPSATQTRETSPANTNAPKPTATPIDLTDRYIASCGNDCTRCPLYGQGCPEGCLGATCPAYCKRCEVRSCTQEHQVANCAYCGEYPCQKLETQYENMKNDGYGSWAKTARAVLDQVRQSR